MARVERLVFGAWEPKTGAVGSLTEARHIIANSFPTERFEPRNVEHWNAHYPRFQEYVGAPIET